MDHGDFTKRPLPWIRQFKPDDLEQVVGNQLVLKYFEGILEDVDNLHSCVLYGPPGCGKTTILHCLKRRFSAMDLCGDTEVEVLELNASDSRTVNDVITKMKPLFTRAISQFEMRILLLDELDNMTVPAQLELAHILAMHEERLQGSRRIFVMAACNDISKIESLLLARLMPLAVHGLGDNDIQCHLTRILSHMDVKIRAGDEDEVWRIIASKCDGDLRVAVNSLHECYMMLKEDKVLTSELVGKILEAPALHKMMVIMRGGLNAGPDHVISMFSLLDELSAQGHLPVDILHLVDQTLHELYSAKPRTHSEICISIAQTYIIFAQGCATLLQIKALLVSVLKIVSENEKS